MKQAKCINIKCLIGMGKRANHKCECGKSLEYKCKKCEEWFSNTRYSNHSPCNDTRCLKCNEVIQKKKIINHKCEKKTDTNDSLYNNIYDNEIEDFLKEITIDNSSNNEIEDFLKEYY